jgi:hypothetical protein
MEPTDFEDRSPADDLLGCGKVHERWLLIAQAAPAAAEPTLAGAPH